MMLDRKQQILDAATKSFTLFGYKATTMDQVARLANVGKGTIYNFFVNKEDLFDEIMTSLIGEMKQVAVQAILPEVSFFENLQRVLFQMLDFRRKHELLIRISHEIREMGTAKAQEGVKKLEQAILAFVQREVSKALEKQEIKRCDPEITAFVILRLYIALISDWEKNHEPLGKEEIRELFRLYLVDGLAVRQA